MATDARPPHPGEALPTSPEQIADRRDFVLRTDAVVRRLVKLRYFSFDIEGAEHLPRQGPVVYAMNHAGWFAMDTLMVGFAVARSIGVERTPYFAAIDTSLTMPVIGPFLRRIGGLPASLFRHPARLPPEFESYGICPEGVDGNTKPFWEAYRMHPWNRGFVRLALALDAPVVPVAVFGGEEAFPVAWKLKVLEPLIGSVVGLPLAAIPLPARWKVVFHPPVRLAEQGKPSRPGPRECDDLARQIQAIVQATLDGERSEHPLARLSTLVQAAKEQVQRNGKVAERPVDLPLGSESRVPAPEAAPRPDRSVPSPASASPPKRKVKGKAAGVTGTNAAPGERKPKPRAAAEPAREARKRARRTKPA